MHQCLEPPCPNSYPDVFEYPTQLGLVPSHVTRSPLDDDAPSIKKGDPVASPLNPYSGLLCNEYTYNFMISEFEPTGSKVCHYPDKPVVSLNNLEIVSKYTNYFICDGEKDCFDGEDEVDSLCG